MTKQNIDQTKTSHPANPESTPESHKKSIPHAHSAHAAHTPAKPHKSKNAGKINGGILSNILTFPKRLWYSFRGKKDINT